MIFFQIFGGLLEVVAQDLGPGPSLVSEKGGGVPGKALGSVPVRLGTNWGYQWGHQTNSLAAVSLLLGQKFEWEAEMDLITESHNGLEGTKFL